MAVDGQSRRKKHDVERKRRERQADQEVVISPCANKRRRKRLEKDDVAWLRWYFNDPEMPLNQRFWYEFTLQQTEMIDAIARAITFGGDQALAASRGEGKTMLFERLLVKYVLCGVISFPVLFAATGTKAEDSLESIKAALQDNDRLCEDYPEVCVPIRALDNTPNRAHYQLVTGKRYDNGKSFKMVSSKFTWCGREIILPAVPGSPASGAIIATRGLDAEVRGLNKKGKRVDLAGIDDPDTEETVNSEDQAEKLEKRIDRGIAGLGGQKRRLARVMLTTLQKPKCVSAKFTDPKQKPSWQGKRFRFLSQKPDRDDLWNEYVSQWQQDLQTGDQHARKAHQFYIDNREAMDAGAVSSNPNRFDETKLPDGSQLELSAIQAYYNLVARIGQDAVSTEYDNDPPAEAGPIESGITAYRIQRQVSGYPRKLVPPGCTLITQGIDVRKVALHKVVRAWRPDGTGYTIDYGVQEVTGTTVGTDEGVDLALWRALQAVAEFLREGPYRTIDGEVVPVALSLVDAGWRTEAIYHSCKELGLGWLPSMGFGKSAGCVQASFSPPVHSSPDKKTGDGWFMSRKPGNVWLVCMDTDRWKAWEHDRWMTPTDKPGTMFVFGESDGGDRLSDDEKHHMSYAKHLTAEIEVEEPIKGVLRSRFKPYRDTNHYLDASYMADVAANMKGIRLLKSSLANPAADIAAKGGWFAAQAKKPARKVAV